MLGKQNRMNVQCTYAYKKYAKKGKMISVRTVQESFTK